MERSHEARIVDIRAPFHNDFRRGLFNAYVLFLNNFELLISHLVFALLLQVLLLRIGF